MIARTSGLTCEVAPAPDPKPPIPAPAAEALAPVRIR